MCIQHNQVSAVTPDIIAVPSDTTIHVFTSTSNTTSIIGCVYSIIGVITTQIIYILIRWNYIPGRNMRKAMNNQCKCSILFLFMMILWSYCINIYNCISICMTIIHSICITCILLRHEIMNVNIRIYCTITCCTLVFALYIAILLYIMP